MGAAGRGRDPDLIDALTRRGRRFGLFQAMRLLRHMDRNAGRSDGRSDGAGGESGGGSGGSRAGNAPGPGDPVRLRTPVTLTYPATAVGGVEAMPDRRPGGPGWSVTVNVIGLTGPAGVMPRHYTQDLIARATEARDNDAEDATHPFLDLFSHRLIDLYYRAWERTKLHVRHERDDPAGPARRLLAVAGAATPGLAEALPVRSGGLTANAAAYFAGMLGQTPRSAEAVRLILGELLGVPVTVEQFVGVWLSLPEDLQTRLGRAGERPQPSAMLGGAVLGGRVWNRRSTLRVRIGPLERGQFTTLLPQRDGPSPAFRILSASLSALLGVSVSVQVQLVLKASAVPSLRLGGTPEPDGGQPMPVILGQSAWLPGRPPGRDADDTILV